MPRTTEALEQSVVRNDEEVARYRRAAAHAMTEGDTRYAEELEEVAQLHSQWAFEDELELGCQLEEAVA